GHSESEKGREHRGDHETEGGVFDFETAGVCALDPTHVSRPVFGGRRRKQLNRAIRLKTEEGGGVRVHMRDRERCANADCGPGAAAERLVGAAAPAPAGPGTAPRPSVSRPFRGGHPWTPRSAPRRTPRSSPTSRR